MILILGAVFVILFVFLGGDRGLRSLGALLINVAVINAFSFFSFN